MSQMKIDFNDEGAEMEQVEQARAVLRFIQVGSRVLSVRFTMLLALTLTFILFMWALVTADNTRLVAATVFGILVYLPTVWLDVRERAVKGD